MEIKYISKDVSVTPARKSSTEEKLAKFSRYFRNRDSIRTVVTIKVLSERQLSAEVSRQAGTVYLRAKAIDADYYNAIDRVVEKLEGQRRKRKTQLSKNNKKIAIIPKEEIKQRLGHSPDALDSSVLSVRSCLMYNLSGEILAYAEND